MQVFKIDLRNCIKCEIALSLPGAGEVAKRV